MINRTTDVRLGLAFFGGCGANNAKLVVDALDPQVHPHIRILVANTDGNQLEHHFAGGNSERWPKDRFQLEQLGFELTKGMGAGGNPEVGKRATEESLEKLRAFLEDLDSLILTGGLGGGSATGALPVMAEQALKQKLPTLAIITMPLAAEGGRRMLRAKAARDRLVRLVPTITVYNENLPEKNIRMSAAWRRINGSCLEPMLRVLREIIQSVGEVINTDLADWTAVLRQGNYVLFGYSEAKSGDKEPDEVASELLHNPFQDQKIITQAEVLLLWFHGPWLVDEIEGVISSIKTEMRTSVRNGTSDEIEVHCGVHEGTDDEKWVGLIAVAPESPALEAQPAEEVAEVPVPTGPVLVHTAPINFRCDGQMVTAKVSEETAKRWRQITSLSYPNPADYEDVCADIKRESGMLPDPNTNWRSSRVVGA